MKHFTVMTAEHIERTTRIHDNYIQKLKETIAECRSEKSVAKNTAELEKAMQKKEAELNELKQQLKETNEAKTYEGKAEFILPMICCDEFLGLIKWDTIEEIVTNWQSNLHETVYIAPLGTYDRYIEAQKEIKKIQDTFVN